MKCIDFSKNNKVLTRKWQFIQMIMFRSETLSCDAEKWPSWLDLMTFELEHELRLFFHGLNLL